MKMFEGLQFVLADGYRQQDYCLTILKGRLEALKVSNTTM